MFNPPLVHSVATPLDRDHAHLVAVGRGDGSVAVYDADGALAAEAPAKGKGKILSGRGCLLRPEDGGHAASTSHVAFAGAALHHGVFSSGNDRALLLWDWARPLRGAGEPGEPGEEGAAQVAWRAQHACKANWHCSAGDHGLVVAGVDGTLAYYDVGR